MPFRFPGGLIKLGMAGAGGGRPGGTKIGQFGLQAFDLETQGRSAGKAQNDHPRRRFSFLKFDRQKIENVILAGRVHVLTLA